MLWNAFAPHFISKAKCNGIVYNIWIACLVAYTFSSIFFLSLQLSCDSLSLCILSFSFCLSLFCFLLSSSLFPSLVRRLLSHSQRNIIYFTCCSPFNHCYIMIYFNTRNDLPSSTMRWFFSPLSFSILFSSPSFWIYIYILLTKICKTFRWYFWTWLGLFLFIYLFIRQPHRDDRFVLKLSPNDKMQH